MVVESNDSLVHAHKIYKKGRESSGSEDHGSIKKQAQHRLLEEIDDIFETLDTNKDGKISLKEFELNLKRIRFFVPKDKIRQMFTRLDIDKSGSIQLEEFYCYAINQQEKIITL